MCARRSIPSEGCSRIEVIKSLLERAYGCPPLRPSGDPIGELVQTILSQHTTDVNAGKAYEQLRQRYPSWHDVAVAPIEELTQSIRIAGLAAQKARTIQTALREIDEASFSDLLSLGVPEARAKLTAIRGVGDKTASCVLLFALGMPAQPVDTHIERVTKRLGITNGESNASGIQKVLEHCLPADGRAMLGFHLSMIKHGREICQARLPKCHRCILRSECDYFARVRIGV